MMDRKARAAKTALTLIVMGLVAGFATYAGLFMVPVLVVDSSATAGIASEPTVLLSTRAREPLSGIQNQHTPGSL